MITTLLTGVNVYTAIDSFERHLRARNLSPRTIDVYRASGRQLARYLEQMGMPTDVGAISREHVESWITHLLQHSKPATARTRFLGVQQLFRFLEQEDEIPTSPMAKLKPPKVPENPPPILSDTQLKTLLATCQGNGFENRRDAALLRVFIDTGARLSEVAGLRCDTLNLHDGTAIILGNGARPRVLHFGAQTVRALDRYLRVRGRHPAAHLPWLWLGHRGRFSGSGIAQMLGHRGKQAGIKGLHAHLFRHLFAHDWLHAGGAESDLMKLAGWRSRGMVDRYGASAAQERAIDAHTRMARGDRL